MKTPRLFLLFTLITCHATEIRVRNDSDTDFKDVVVGGKKYGDIKLGDSTDYQHWEVAYRYSSVSLSANSKPVKMQTSPTPGAA